MFDTYLCGKCGSINYQRGPCACCGYGIEFKTTIGRNSIEEEDLEEGCD